MASGNLLLGYGRNSIGDVTFYRSGGMQRSRARNRSPKNPRTASQAVQRMVLSTAAKLAGAYEPLVNHSWEGKTNGAVSVQYFRSLAMATLRAAAIARVNYQSGDPTPPKADFCLRGAPTIGFVDGLKISEGRLPVIGPLAMASNTLTLTLTDTEGAITDQATYEAELAKLGLEPGDQLTIVWQAMNFDAPVAEFVDTADYSQQIRYCRVTFKAEPTIAASSTLIASDTWNPIFVESVEGVWPVLGISGKSLTFDIDDSDGYATMGATLIRSKRIEAGKVYYSPAVMVVDTDTVDYNDAYDTYQSYMDGAQVIIGEQKYLKNAVAVPFGLGE